jgi:hypothetical protein
MEQLLTVGVVFGARHPLLFEGAQFTIQNQGFRLFFVLGECKIAKFDCVTSEIRTSRDKTAIVSPERRSYRQICMNNECSFEDYKKIEYETREQGHALSI